MLAALAALASGGSAGAADDALVAWLQPGQEGRAEMRALPGYNSLRDLCLGQGVVLHESTMSLTGMVNLGKGALMIGFAAEGQLFKD